MTLSVKNSLILFFIFFVGCSANVTNYKGKEINVEEKGFVIIEVENSEVENNVFHITAYKPLRFPNYMNEDLIFRGFKRAIYSLMDEYGYSGYHVIRESTDKIYSLNVRPKYFYEIRFHKTEEDFDKWDERYRL